MNTVLLLGAGFSRNWGGWLADEVVDYLLAAPEVRADPALKDLIWQHANAGFESALEQLQQQAAENPESAAVRQRLVDFQSALERMFSELNAVFFEDPDFEFNNQIGSTVREFLARFDAIFTLNQDLLLEHNYIDRFNVALVSPRRWDAVQIPGMRRLPVTEALYHQSWARAEWQPLPDSDYTLAPRCQPYIKLHGSSNWKSGEGQRLLVMGGNKSGQIQGHRVLARYAQEFSRRLLQPNTHLVVIGYGFRDHHINREIERAVYHQGLKFFVIAPQGRNLAKALSSESHPGAAMTVFGYDLENIFREGLGGASQRALREIFRGGDPDHAKLLRFLRG